MSLSSGDCEAIIQAAIVQAGGVNVTHPLGSTLHAAGLKATHQRASFQRHVARGLGEHRYKLDEVGNIPNQGSTTLSKVRDYISVAATPIELDLAGNGPE